jgi:simple sugar transport system permease protein
VIALQARPAPSPLFTVASPFIAIALTLGASALLMAAMGRDAGEALWVYFVSPFLDGYSRAEIVVKAVPLALIGAGLSVCFRANVWNIGAAGQFTAGAVAAGGLALALPQAQGPLWLIPYLGLGALGGMALAAIPAALRTRFNANEILVSLMLTYVAALLLDLLVRGPWRSPLSFGFPQTAEFADAFVLPGLLTGTRLHLGVALALVAALALQAMMALRLRGFSIRVIGAAPRAGAFGGFSSPGTVWFAFLLSGGLAGLAGAVEVSAVIGKLQPDIGALVGFSAIIVAFLGRLTPLGAVLGALALAVAGIGGENAQILLKLPKNVTGVFQGLLLFFLLACDTLIRWKPVMRRLTAARG